METGEFWNHQPLDALLPHLVHAGSQKVSDARRLTAFSIDILPARFYNKGAKSPVNTRWMNYDKSAPTENGEEYTMNGKERLDAYLAGKKADRRPNLTIVGSVVTQYTGIDIERYSKDYKAMTESAVQAAIDLKLDFIQIASDLVREAEGLGSEIAYFPDKLPTVRKYALDDITEVSRLRPLKTSEVRRMYDLVEATAYARTLNSDIHPMTLAVGPATIAGNTRGVEGLLVDMLDEEEAGEDLLNIATETILDYIRTLASAGATYIYVADPVASLFSPSMYERFVLPCHRKIFGLMKELGIGSRLHMCGDTTKILPFSSTCGADIVDIDHAVNFAKALEIADGRCLINGNIDPVADVFSCDAAHTKQAILNAADSIGRARAMFMPGCELPTRTPLANARAISEALEEIGG